MAHDPRDRHVKAIIDAFLQSRSTEQSQDYLARGRRFSTFEVKQLNQGWITATRRLMAPPEVGLPARHKRLNKEWMIWPRNYVYVDFNRPTTQSSEN
jgi:hypothetical protein